MRKPIPTLLSLPLLLLACRPVGPTYVPPRPAVPETFTAPGGATALKEAWWELLGDAQLDALVRKALVDSPDLQIAEARLRQARAQLGIQEAAGGPSLGASAKVTRDQLSRNSEGFANMPIKNPQTQFTNEQVGFDASWELDFFGRNRRLVEGARARAEAGADRLRDTALVLSAEVARNYIDYRQGQARLALAEATLGLHREGVRLAVLQEQAGEISRQDLARVETGRANQEASLAALRTGVRQSLAALSTLTDLPLASLEAQLGASRPLAAVPGAPPSGLPAELLQRRPDLRASERDLAAASADVGVAVADRYPRLTLVGTGGWNAISSETLLSRASRMWSVGPQLSLPIFNSGRLASAQRASEAAFEAARGTHRKAVLGAVADAEVALTRLARSEERRVQLEGAEAQVRRQVGFTQRQVEAGEVSRLALLEAQKNLAAQQDQTLQAHGQSLTSLVSLCKALGGGWETGRPR